MPERKRGGRHINWFALILAGIIIYFASILISQQMYLSQARTDQVAAEARLKAAQEENAALRAEQENLGRLDYVEKLAREELGMTRHGELPYSTGRK